MNSPGSIRTRTIPVEGLVISWGGDSVFLVGAIVASLGEEVPATIKEFAIVFGECSDFSLADFVSSLVGFVVVGPAISLGVIPAFAGEVLVDFIDDESIVPPLEVAATLSEGWVSPGERVVACPDDPPKDRETSRLLRNLDNVGTKTKRTVP